MKSRKASTAVVPAVDPLPWEKQKGESQKAFHAFSIYRDLGPTRSQSKVGEILAETRVASPDMVERWSPKWRWVERVDAYDREQDRKQLAAQETARADANRLRAMTGTLAVGASLSRLRGDANARDEAGNPRPIERLDPNTMDAGEVARLAETGNKLLAAGLGETLDLKGSILVSGPAVQGLARDLLSLAIARIEETARAVVERPADVDSIAMRMIDATIGDAEALFRKSLRT